MGRVVMLGISGGEKCFSLIYLSSTLKNIEYTSIKRTDSNHFQTDDSI